ncbi:PTS sugar transporter subunit IIA [Deferrisoma camini]|uniref:PTS sugar transporter subunit IIA n=1 Tax=Deferrisoma camini TaxID=1035120 RepID=UPI00046D10A7|nr:PTS sugar transporter subunit IIA [Deferrisoma camini]
MNLLEFLPRERILPHLKARDKEGVLAELVEVLVAEHKVRDGRQAVQVLLDRERLGSTGIGEGIAIPHGKLRDLDELVAVFGRSPEGVEFDSMDGAPVHLFFLLMAPENSASTHLKALARISRLLKDRSFREELLQADSQEELYEIIAREDEKY